MTEKTSTCEICKKTFTRRQSNYKTCSSNCRKIHNKLKQKEYYRNNKASIIERLSKNSKRPKIEQICVICDSTFKDRQNTKCCSDECRHELNRCSSIERYYRKRCVNNCARCDTVFTDASSNDMCRQCRTLDKWGVDDATAAYKKRKRLYVRNRYKTDINYRLADNLRSRLNSVISRQDRAGSSVKDLGCTVEELKKHLESQFTEGMSWDNYGKGGWEIDHIQPLASFDLTNREDLLKACHYTNLQPLWARDNRSKGGRHDLDNTDD